MSNKITAWPEGLQTRTAEEWIGLANDWSNTDSRAAVMTALKELKIPATEYARKQVTERAELIIKLQEQLLPGSTKPGGAAPAKAAASATGSKKAAPKAAAAAAPAAGATVDLSELLGKLDELQATASRTETLLKLLLLNPANTDSLQLAADPDVLAEFASKSIEELAGNA